MDAMRKIHFLAGTTIVLLGLPVIAAQEDCGCAGKCIQWIIIAAVAPILIIGSVVAIVKWCQCMSRKRLRIDTGSSGSKTDDEKTGDPENDVPVAFDQPPANHQTDHVKRRKSKRKESPEPPITPTVEVISEISREESWSDVNNDRSKNHRKKKRKLTEVGGVSKVQVGNVVKVQSVEPKRISHNSRSDSLRNTFSTEETSSEESLRLHKEEPETAVFLCSEDVENNGDVDDTRHISANEADPRRALDDNKVTFGQGDTLENALNILDEAIALNKDDQEEDADEFDDEQSELQGLSDKSGTGNLRQVTPSPAADFFDLSRPKSPEPDEEIQNAFSAHSVDHQDMPQRTVTPFPGLSGGAKPRKKSKFLKSKDTILEAEEEQRHATQREGSHGIQREGSIFFNFTDSKKPQGTRKDKTSVNDSARLKESKGKLVDEGATLAILKQRSVTPMPFGSKSQVEKTSGKRSKTPDPFLSKQDDSWVIQVKEQKQTTFINVKDPLKTFPHIPNSLSKNVTRSSGDDTRGHHVEEVFKTSNTMNTPMSSKQDPFCVTRDTSKPPTLTAGDPFITDLNRPRGHLKPITNDKSLEFSKSFSAKPHEVSVKKREMGRIEQSDTPKKEVGQNEREFSDPKFPSPRSKTPDPFGNQIKPNATGQRVRSKTPDPFTSMGDQKLPVKDKQERQSEERLGNLLSKSEDLKGKRDRLAANEVLQDESLSRLIRDATRRAATPDPDMSEQRGLVYNKMFANDVRRSKSVNTPNTSKTVGTGKKFLRLGDFSNTFEMERTRNKSPFENNVSSNDILKQRQKLYGGATPKDTDVPSAKSDRAQLPFLSRQTNSPTAEFGENETDDNKIHNAYDKGKNMKLGTREDSFELLMNTIDSHVKTAQTVADTKTKKSSTSRNVYDDGNAKDKDDRKVKSTAAKLRARRQNMGENLVELDDLPQKLEAPDMKSRAGQMEKPLFRSPVSLEGIVKDKPSQMSARFDTGSQEPGLRKPSLNRTESLGNRQSTYSDDEDGLNQTQTSVNRSKSVNERKLFKFEPDASVTGEEETRRKRKHTSSLKVQLPDLTLVPKKGILKNTPSSASSKGADIGIFPLSQFVSSGKDGRLTPTVSDKFFKPGKPRSIMFAGSPSLFGGREEEDNRVQRSLSYNERRRMGTPVSERPPTPGVFSRHDRNPDWKMSTTKF